MILSDVAFRDTAPVCINSARTTAKFREQQIEKLRELILNLKEPIDYYEISEKCGLEIGYDLSVKGRKYTNPHRAQSLVTAMIKKYPDDFEIIRLPFRDGRGTLHFRPHVQRAVKGLKL